ncbi:YciI-like protein [Oceanobacillus picturae]|uniref:YciI-like protein n=1 Tax=Oceanobacillus picturae TaxID=171693 RepID=W9ABU7_9BACI|nr:YciI family protein [Oceanobacillus picturae]CDO02973.1 YciI-like protein [Oceanobacillus picturae]
MRYLILLTPSKKWRDGVALHNQPVMPEHAVYVQTEYNKGNIVLAGPFGGSTGGAIVIDAETEEDVITFADYDPTVKNGIFSYEIKQWDYKMSKCETGNPAFDQGYVDYKHKIQKELGII